MGLRKLLSHIKRNYGDPEIYITENGWSEKGEDQRIGEAALNDEERVGYLKDYINEALKATVLDGVKLKGLYLKILMYSRSARLLWSSSHAVHHDKFSHC